MAMNLNTVLVALITFRDCSTATNNLIWIFNPDGDCYPSGFCATIVFVQKLSREYKEDA